MTTPSNNLRLRKQDKQDGGVNVTATNPDTRESKQCSQLSTPTWPISMLASVIMGYLFGTSFYKSHVFEPMMIRGQFLFRRFIMLKLFFGAMGTGALLFAILSYLGFTHFNSARMLWKPTSSTRSWLTGTAFGGCLLGIGMALSGACPGMAPVSMGAGTFGASFTILGGLLGALTYGLNANKLSSLQMRGPKGPASEVYADEALGVPYYKIATILGVVCLTGCAVLEMLFPWQEEVPERLRQAVSECAPLSSLSIIDLWSCPAWNPSLAGILVGSLQLPAVMCIQQLLGSALAYQVMTSVLFNNTVSKEYKKKHSSYMNIFATPNPKAWWQVIYIGSSIWAAHHAASTAGDVGMADAVDNVASFLGGFLMIFGSRLAGGCTSGHGLSGCAILMIQSWIAVPAMFAGGIVFSVVMQSLKGAEFYSLS